MSTSITNYAGLAAYIAILAAFIAGCSSASSSSSIDENSSFTELTNGTTHHCHNPTWSSDGNTIFFTENDDRTALGLSKIVIDGSGMVNLTNDPNHDYVNLPGSSLCASNGKLVISSDKGGHDNIWTIDTVTGEMEQLTDGAYDDYEPTWSSDCSWIAFQSKRDENWDIYKMKADGTSITRLTSNAADDSEPNWSPNGEWIAFQSKRNEIWQIYLIKPDGSSLTQLTSGESEATDPSWFGNGAKIVMSYDDANDSNGEDIFSIDITTKELKNLTNHSGYEGAPSVSPDGTQLAFEADWNGRTSIWISTIAN